MPNAVESIYFVNAEEVTDEIVKRLACNELPAEAGEYIRKLAGNGSMFYTTQLGYGPTPFMLDSTFKPDGSLQLRISDYSGQRIWETTLKAPPPAPKQVHITHQVQCDGRSYDCP